MNPRQLAQALAVGRIALGAAYLLAPKLAAAQWVGSDASKTGTQVLAAAFGARDIGLGAGALAALHTGQPTKTWTRAAVLADAADLTATLRNRDDLPKLAVAGVTAMAASATVAGLYLQAALD